MRSAWKTLLAAALALVLASPASAADPLKKLSVKLAKSMKDAPNKKVAVLSFGYTDGGSNSGSTIVQERMTTYLVEGGRLEVLERNLLKKVLEEKNLEMTGLIDPATTRELGKLLGVGAVVTGTLNDLDEKKTEVNARAIDTQSGKILAAGMAVVERTWTDAVRHTASTPVQIPPKTGEFLGKPMVQLAILLDTSSSMDGLIHQARTQLWKIVNELAGSEKGGNNPTVEVAVYEYGNDDLKADAGYARQVISFTKDLDHVSEKLFALKTNGGQEYAGWTIQAAVDQLKWLPQMDVYKAIFIAGNEPFTQGKVDFRDAVAAAVKKGIIVNTIFCGGRQEGVATQWKAGADLSSGDFSNIDQQVQVVSIRAPQDDEIARLGVELNGTFIPYGKKGKLEDERRMAQDMEMSAPAALSAGGATQRAIFKASRQYAESASDVVGALRGGSMKESDLQVSELPENLQKMDAGERKAYIQKQSDERRRIQEKINQLNAERQRYVAQKEKELAQGGGNTLDAAVLGAIRSQASKKGFRFKK
ncbi:MAG TPA: VWA domain-containing protein [Elusimicrobia bacterium]|nr:VWA domain-containing protein [Elusimicrobiota bacterium]